MAPALAVWKQRKGLQAAVADAFQETNAPAIEEIKVNLETVRRTIAYHHLSTYKAQVLDLFRNVEGACKALSEEGVSAEGRRAYWVHWR